MKFGTLLYAAVGSAAIAAGLIIPWVVHRSGSTAVAGWESLVTPGPLSASHAFIAEKCETCHTPHKSVDAQKCVACHAITEFQNKASTRFHADVTNCRDCHIEHGRPRSLTKMDHAALLEPRLWVTQPPELLPTEEQSFREYLSSKIGAHAPDTAARLKCAACHAVRDPHGKLFGEACNSCHAMDTWNISDFRHPGTTSMTCAECHRPPPSHLMMHFVMVSKVLAGKDASVDQCYACHTTDSWNNIRGKGFYDHH